MAVDPEMLGHIFENLLEDNKDKGAFYTPKEIVHYMCQESLIEFLATHCLNYNSNDLGKFPSSGNLKAFLSDLVKLKIVNQAHLNSEQENEEWLKMLLSFIDELLTTVKICDPAIGSGAFPMGLLQEIFTLKEVITYETKASWNPAQVKENIIQNSIYGVDIEKGAVDIARLRFWLSLVVNEDKPKALPNLDYKIVVGDSLVSKFEDKIIEVDWEVKEGTQTTIFGNENVLKQQELLQKISDKQSKFFHPKSKNKPSLHAEIRDLKIDILINQLELMIKTNGIEKQPLSSNKKFKDLTILYNRTQDWKETISKLRNLRKDKDKIFKHFDWKLNFPEVLNPNLVLEEKQRGFDILIGNPPYVDSETMMKSYPLIRDVINRKFKAAKGNWDLYIPFHELAINLMRVNGVKAFISPNKWLSIAYATEFRRLYKNKCYKICNCNGVKVFEAGVTPVISFFKCSTISQIYIDRVNQKFEFSTKNIVESELIDQNSLGLLLSNSSSILLKIKRIKTNFKDYIICENPFSTSEAYQLCDILIDSNNEKEEFFKLINTGTIDPYISLWGTKQTTYLKSRYLHPIAKLNDLNKLFPRRVQQIKSRKLIITGMRYLECFFDIDGEYIAGKSTLIIKEVKEDNYLLFCALLNSKLISFFIKESYSSLGIDGGVNFTKSIIEDVPLPTVDSTLIEKFSCFVEYIIFLKKINLILISEQLMPAYFQQIIDGMVYELYFPDLLKNHNREIISHLGELPRITDNMNDEKKLSIIKTVFNRLNDREHQIRVNMFYINSIPEIAIIEGKHENN
ncbi:Eco57I restriction-modification methylase domain-containing protein [Adhaeribacter rhizoryzae]|uniref:site-specific DNA-methyltransferase (adenine-specific) n=1 Tax=Adhaeribacter rhizoryzae TaxID=2607907 RepID=A0A5M6DPD6_9BACT|nr:Eco57I restriction-modification methylase domain-containing protein [Adhaeribacter rhizoryzae]KAA5548092.1 hypothetical protein F0145_05030 [Adhaeribacter rhizoryzae]